MRLCLILLNEGVFRRRLGDGAGCGARAQVSQAWTREAFGAPLGRHYERPARSWLTSGRDQKVAWTSSVARGQKSPRWSAERRAGHGPAISGKRRSARPRGGPRGAAIRTSAVSALRPPRLFEGESTANLGAHALARMQWAV